ncbi:hypothetical protein C1I98_13335 [Spongiactinospora gelatinilytica]|uniref:Acb2/Tad1 hairpin domain-containing protein n=1 Tax=Spongiactinospora gelatinilytica TaxID=2666298 RepID=A0A2W2GY48_9ACTN|nr:hypothetical protein [Spongiactinospora gelatinilytica]PZG47449.1 hypothetical protein C1I98_13335 [Spongiactinospora gelatinilytica]
MSPEELANRFAYHPPLTDERRAAHETVRDLCWKLAVELNGLLPEGREKSLAIKSLEEAMFWSNAGVARQD